MRRHRVCYWSVQIRVAVAQLLSHVSLFVPVDCNTRGSPALHTQSCLTVCAGFPVSHISHTLLKLMSIKSVMPSNHLILCHPLLLLPPIFPSIRVFSSESALHLRWPKYWVSASACTSNEYSRLIFFRMDWFNLLVVQGALKSLLQHHSLKASILQCSAFFMNQASHQHMTAGKSTTLTITKRRSLKASLK